MSEKNCGTCAHELNDLSQQPCSSCVGGQDFSNWEPLQKASRIGIADQEAAPTTITVEIGDCNTCAYEERDGEKEPCAGCRASTSLNNWTLKPSLGRSVIKVEPVKSLTHAVIDAVIVRNGKFVGEDKPEQAGIGDINSNAKNTNPKDAVGIRKAPMSTVSAAVLAEVGVAMLEGAAKYGRHNYRVAGVRASVYYDGTMRHLMSWWEGEDLDPDSQMSHITKAITSLVVLRDAMIQGMCTDDRPPRSADFYTALNARSAAIVDAANAKGLAPRHYTITDTGTKL